jgi:hypothetical protein
MPRDKEILDLIDRLGAASLTQIKKLFMNGNKQGIIIARRRMKRLYDLKLIKRDRSFINTEYVYFKKNTLIEHKLALTEFYAALQSFPGKILKFDPEKPLDDIRPDALCDYLYKNNVYQFFIEVHLSNILFDQQKYEDFYAGGKYRQWYPVFPRVVVISDRDVQFKASKIRYFKIPLSCQGIEYLFK